MAIRAELADGRVLEFPDGTAPEVVQRVVKQQVLLAQAKAEDEKFQQSLDPTIGMNALDRGRAGAGKAMTDIARGAGQMMGLVPQAQIDEAAKRDAPLMDTRAGQVGNVVGAVGSALPAMMIPGANTIAGAGLIGAAQGALQPTQTGQSRMANMAVGGAGGAIGQGLGNSLSRMLNPQTSKAAMELMDQGITPTPGQILGGGAKRIEAAAETLPFVGQGIRESKSRAVREFNLTALNRALAPVGQRVDDIGHAGMSAARDKIDDAYKAALGKLPRVDFDQPFDDALSNIRQMGARLKPDSQKQLEVILQQDLLDKLTPAKTLSGESFKQVESSIKTMARDLRKSTTFDDRQLGDALNAVVGELRDLAGRNSPAAAEALKNADTAYAMLLRLERAASMQGAPDGVFSAAQLGNSVRSMDSSLRRGAIARGEGLMQDLTTAGREVLGGEMPNSGTPERLLNALLLGGGYAIDPMLAAGAVAGRAAYTAPAQKGLATLLAGRTPAMRAAGDYVRIASPALALTGTQAALQ